MFRSFLVRVGFVLVALVVSQSVAMARTCAEVQAEIARLLQTLANEQAALANCRNNLGTCTPGQVSGFELAIQTAEQELAADEAERRTACAPPTPPNADRVELQGIEVVQAVQDSANSVHLIAGKKTWVRVYFDKNSGTRSLTATLRAQRGTKTVSLSPVASINVNAAENLRARRQNWSKSLNFLLPSAVTSSGTTLFTITAVRDVSLARTTIICSNCGNPTQASFFNTPPLIIQPVAMSYTFRPNPALPATVTATPSNTDITLFKSWLTRAYPVAQVILGATSTLAIGFPLTFDSKQTDCTNGNATLAALRAIDVSLRHKDSRTHYIGFVSNQGGFVQGCTSSIPATADPSATAVSPAGSPGSVNTPVNVTGDTDASFADWYGSHELAHTFGRQHPGFCNKNSASDPSFPYPNGQISDGTPTTFAGLDVGDAANGINLSVLWGSAITSPIGFTVAPATFDIMTYCNQPQWVSAYHYEAIRQRLLDENPGFTQLRLTPLATGMLSGSLVHVVATLNLTKRSGSIVYITPVRRAVPTVGPTGRAELVARDSNGNELYRRSVPIKLISDINPGEDELAIVDAAIPLVGEMTRIELTLEGQVIARFESSQQTPRAVSNLRVSRAPESEGLRLSWVPAPTDRGSISYMVFSSMDGKTWALVAVGLTTPEITLTRDIARSRMLRVIATNGFRNSLPASVNLTRGVTQQVR